MKTPEEIKKGLELCCVGVCTECPYKEECDEHLACGGDMLPADVVLTDILALIQQLQEDKKQLERERDVYASELHGICVRCTHVKKCLGPKCYLVEVGMEENTGCDQCYCRNCVNGSNWQWRGVQQEDKT